jgi:hypothetical protein
MARALSMFLLLAMVTHARCRGIEMSVGGRADGKDFWFHVSAEVVKKTPAWMPTSSCPPLEPRQAIEIATKQLHGLVKNPSLWAFSQFALFHFSADHWVYIVEFDRHYPENVAVSFGDWFAIPVLMSGSTIEPKVLGHPPDVIEHSK